MRRYVIISTTMRGKVDPPEPVGEQDQRMIQARVAQEAYYAQLERDPPLSHWRQVMQARQPVRKPPHRLTRNDFLTEAWWRKDAS